MSAMENLLVQIFERKNRIIDNVKQQILLFDHHLASTCLIDGFAPPPWLLSSSLSELNKEDFTSELLFSHVQPSNPYFSLYQLPVVTTDSVQLADVSCTLVDASNEVLDQCVSGKADELDPSVTSPPQVWRDEKSLNDGPDLGLSLARITRSKSRQRALEHRNSAKSCKNVENSKKNGDVCNSQENGSNIASLQCGPVDKLELIRSDNNVVSCVVEGKGGQCLREERSENVYSGRVTRARSSVQPSKSAGGPSSAGNTTCVAKLANVVVLESISKPRQQPDAVHELVESKFNEPFHNIDGFPENNEERGQCWMKERSEDVYSDKIMRSKSSAQPPKSVSCPPSAGNSFCSVDKDGVVLTEFIKKSRLQPDTTNELLHFIKPVDNVATCVVTKVERGFHSKEKGKNMYSGRITRSRSSVQLPEFVNGNSSTSRTSDAAKSDSNLLGSMKPVVNSDKCCGSRNAQENRNKEKETNAYQGRLTRSRSSIQQQHDHVNKLLKVDNSPDRSNGNGICKSIQLAFNDIDPNLTLPCDITYESCVLKDEAGKHQKENAVVGKSNGSCTRRRASSAKTDESCVMKDEAGKHQKENAVVAKSNGSCTRRRASSAKLLKIVHSSDTLEDEVAQFKSTAYDKSPNAKLSDRYERVELNEALNTQVHSMPCVNDGYLADLNTCDAIVADTDADSDELVEADLASSASNLNGADNLVQQSLNSSEKIELDILVTSPHFESVMPKQLDFDHLGECISNEASDLRSKTEDEIKSLDERPLTHFSSADKLNELTSVHHQEKYNWCLENMSETDLNRASEAGRTSSLNVVSSVKETPKASLHAVTSTLQERNKISEQNNFMEDHPTMSKVADANIRKSAKDISGLWKCSDTRTDFLIEKDFGKLTCLSESSKACRGPATLADIHLTGVCNSSLIRKTYATCSDETEHPYAALVEETEGNAVKQKKVSSSQNVVENLMGSCTADGFASILDPTHSKSSNYKDASQSTQPRRHGSDVDSSWPCKRRKIDGQQSNSPSFSFRSKEKCALEEKCRNESSSYTFVHKKLASVSSFPHEVLENSENLSADRTGTVDACDNMLDSATANEFQTLLDVGDISEFVNIEHLACDDRSKKECISQLREACEFSSCFISSPCQPPTDFINADQTSPELEGFNIQIENEQICIGEGISFDKLDLPKTTLERASLLEQLCKSASIQTPSSQFPTTFALQRATDFYQSVPNGLLECIDLRCSLPTNGDRKSPLKVSSSFFGDNIRHAFLGGHFSDCLPCSSSQVNGDIKKPYLSPVSKLWDRIPSNSDSSEKRGSLKSELPCISEENENADEIVEAFHGTSASKVVNSPIKRKPLAEITEFSNAPVSVSEAEMFTLRDSLDSMNTSFSFTGNEKGVKQKVGKSNASRMRDNNKIKDNLSIPPVANRNRFSRPKPNEKTNLKSSGQQKETKVNNIVSNVTSFIPLVQQKQAAAVITGKRDVKVKALEAAEAAKRLAEKKENDRKMKKEALKVERARLEQENLRQLELEKKKKEEEKKQKEADMAARKRQREEEERFEKDRKRKRMEKARKPQHAPEEKLCAKKDDKETKCQALNERAQIMKLPSEKEVKYQKMKNKVADGNDGKSLETEITTVVASTSDAPRATTTIEDCNVKVKNITFVPTYGDNLTAEAIQEESYDISPYKGSDDEDEDDEDDQPNRKFIPSWASKSRVAQLVSFQQKLDPEVIFPPKSFCSISEVLLPRKLRQSRVS